MSKLQKKQRIEIDVWSGGHHNTKRFVLQRTGITKYFKKYTEKFEAKKNTHSYIQSVVSKRTSESVLIDFRIDCLMSDWLAEDIERCFNEIDITNH